MSQQQQDRTRPPRRRRPRPFSSADQVCGDDATNTMCDALSLSTKIQIDTILEKRQKEGPPQPKGGDAYGAYNSTSGSDIDGEAGGDGRHVNAVLEEGVASPADAARRQKQPPVTDEELAETHADVFGRLPPEAARTEERLQALEIEVGRLPKEERTALTKAMEEHPFLFVNCPHTKLLLQQGEEVFDATAAARRLAKYWECRRSLFGDGECYAHGFFPTVLNDTDFKRFYARTRAILNDPRTDEMARRDAEDIVDIIHKRKLDGLNKVLGRMEEASMDEVNPGEHDTSARSMAMASPEELKLQFLRVEDMDLRKAAQRLFRYWQMGLRLFGPALLHSKRATLADLEDCSELLSRCYQFRLMPEEDEFGRSVIVSRQIISPDGEDSSNSLMSEEQMRQFGINEDHSAKIAWYMLHAAMERESCLDNGYVLICDVRIGLGNTKRRQRHRQAMSNVQSCVPVKMCAAHVLIGPGLPWLKQQALRALSYLFGLSYQQRFVFHLGAMEDILDMLGGDFGIRVEKLPVDLGGTVEAEHFSRWLEERRDADL